MHNILIADDTEIVAIGGQSVLGQFPNAPASLLISAEADVYPRNRPKMADLVDGSIGEGSPFHEEFGYYAQGVGPETAILPAGWQQQLAVMNVPEPLRQIIAAAIRQDFSREQADP